MIQQPVTSSDLKSVGYDPTTRTLEIEFHSGGVCQYDGVPPTIHTSLMAASSHGSYFHRHIKDRYQDRRIR